jgi:hypothetical protein
LSPGTGEQPARTDADALAAYPVGPETAIGRNLYLVAPVVVYSV